MRFAPILPLTVALVAAGCRTMPDRAESSDPRIQRIDGFVRRAFGLGVTPGLGVAVVSDGRIVYTAALGHANVQEGIPVTDSTLWYVASTSKSFTGFGVALLEAAGEIDLSAPIPRILPRATWHPSARPNELTLASFLSHTHGLNSGPLVTSAAYTGAFPEEQFVRLLAFSEPLPSRELSYSNLGYNVASMAIAERRPEGWKAYLDRHVFAPAGLRDIHHRVTGIPPRRIAKAHQPRPDGSYQVQPFLKRDLTMNAAGGHLASIADLARWTILHMDDGRLDGRQIFPTAVVRRSHEILGRQNAQFAYFQRDGWGFGWDIGSYDGEPMVSRFGSYTGFRSHLSMLPGRRVGVVAQVNSTPGWRLTDIIAAYAYDVFLGRTDADARGQARLDTLVTQHQARRTRLAGAAPPVHTPPRPPSDYVGIYEDAALGRIEIVPDETGLRIRWGVLPDLALDVRDPEKQIFVTTSFGGLSPIQFIFNGSGRAEAIETEGRRAVRR
ncbi:MAG TPA: serine hydrolase domain-containing protein [Gemmatimonadaceae bacterium]|nr:serine hydrolase domain-containing protein [Gemmatimonadaceae bacterium]